MQSVGNCVYTQQIAHFDWEHWTRQSGCSSVVNPSKRTSITLLERLFLNENQSKLFKYIVLRPQLWLRGTLRELRPLIFNKFLRRNRVSERIIYAGYVSQRRDTFKRKLAQVRFFVWMAAKGAKRATQLKSVHAWVALFDSNFIGTINFIAKISGQRNEWKTRVGWGGFIDLFVVARWMGLFSTESNQRAYGRKNYSPAYCETWWMNWNFNVIGYRRWSSAYRAVPPPTTTKNINR